MPLVIRVLMLGALGLAALTFACGGDDDGESTETPTPTRTATPRTRTPTRTDGPSPTDDELKSPPVDETPNGNGPTPTGGGSPERTPAAEGTRMTVISATDFGAKYSGETLDPELPCPFNPVTAGVDCGDRGLFAPDPVPAGPGVECFLLSLRGSAIGLRCQQQEPLQTIYYEPA